MARRRTTSARRYEVLLIIEAEDDHAAHTAANAAWYGADDTPGAEVADSLARRRCPDGSVEPVTWDDWGEESSVDLSVGYDDTWDER